MFYYISNSSYTSIVLCGLATSWISQSVPVSPKPSLPHVFHVFQSVRYHYVRLLYKLQHHIGLLLGPPTLYYVDCRVDCFVLGMHGWGVPVHVHIFAVLQFIINYSLSICLELRRKYPVIHCYNHFMRDRTQTDMLLVSKYVIESYLHTRTHPIQHTNTFLLVISKQYWLVIKIILMHPIAMIIIFIRTIPFRVEEIFSVSCSTIWTCRSMTWVLVSLF